MKKGLLSFIFFLLIAVNSWSQEATVLKMRQPNWRSEIVKKYPSGSSEVVVFYEPLANGSERAVKQLLFYESGQMKQEKDLALVDKESEGYKAWNSMIVPSGVSLDFFENGKPSKVSLYDRGLLNGEEKTFYASGKLKSKVTYIQGKADAKLEIFYESGHLKEEGTYANGKLEGEYTYYAEEGNRIGLVPYRNGLVEGKSCEWHLNQSIKSERLFEKGKLHGNEKTPALVIYNENRSIIEALDFREGIPVGAHCKYHKDGKESYRVFYKNGKKEGKEQFFAENGSLLGEGLYKEGTPIGKHWKKHSNGKEFYHAEFDQAGNFLSPVTEYNDQGIKVRVYFLKNNQLEGYYLECYEDGTPRLEYNYAAGEFDGEQKEYYPSSQIKLCSHYQRGIKDGLHEEWHENGILAKRALLVQGEVDQKIGEWYANGKPKKESNFLDRKPHGLHTEWYENGLVKSKTEFENGKKTLWQRQWNEQEELVFEEKYVDGLLTGDYRAWYSKDKPKEVGHYENGKKEGRFDVYYENGTLLQTATYKDDLLEGEYKGWYPDGSPKFSQFFVHNTPVGEQKEYYPVSKGGSLYRIVSYNKEGKLHGEQKTFHSNKSIETLISYDAGTLHGRKGLWDEKGNLLEEANYQKGKLQGTYFQKTEDGKEIVYTYKNNLKEGPHMVFYKENETYGKIKALQATYVADQVEGIISEYNEKGIRVVESEFHNGKKNGTALLYSPDGKLFLKLQYKDDKRNGLALQYYPNGKVFRQVEFINDEKNGEEKSFYDDGKLSSINFYKNGNLHGKCTFWNQTGVIVYEADYQMGKRHGKMNKYFDDGKLQLEQFFKDDKLHGLKKKYEKNGEVAVSTYKDGKCVD